MAASAAEGSGEALPSTMRAWQFSAFKGGAEGLKLAEGVAVPLARAGHVLVRVRAASLNAIDYKLQDGFFRPVLPLSLPFTPGMDAAGDVVALPPGGSSLFKLGDTVFGATPLPAGGCFAEYVLLPEASSAVLPEGISHAQGLCVVVAGCAALQALRDSGGVPLGPAIDARLAQKDPPPQDPPLNIMLANASGGVGIMAVQLARLAGEHITATCGERNMEFVRTLGADEVLDYRSHEGQALSSPSGRKYDVLLDGTHGLTWKVVGPVLGPTGKWLHLSPDPAIFASAALSMLSKQRLVPVTSAATSADLTTLAGLVAQGALKVDVDSELPFSELPEAWKKCQTGRYRGKIIIKLD